jgi:hypothetical protein
VALRYWPALGKSQTAGLPFSATSSIRSSHVTRDDDSTRELIPLFTIYNRLSKCPIFKNRFNSQMSPLVGLGGTRGFRLLHPLFRIHTED